MTDKRSFATAVLALLRQLNMELPPEAVFAEKIYTISTGQLDIDLTGTEDGRITLFCFPGALPKLHLESLATLLLSNRYQQAYPPILTSLVGQTVPPKILLWSSLRYDEAGQNVSTLLELFIRMAEAADDVQAWIAGGMTSEYRKEATSAHIDWLKGQLRPVRVR